MADGEARYSSSTREGYCLASRLAASSPWDDPPIPVGKGAEWAPNPDWTLWETEKCLSPSWEPNHDFLVVGPISLDTTN